MRRLLELLPEDAWSEAGKQKVRRAVQVFLPPPRAAIIAPEPSYSEWPVVERAQAMQSWLSRDLGFDPDLVRWVRRRLENVLQIGPGRQVGMEFRDWPQCPQELRVAIDASLAMLEEIGDSQLLNLDFQRGRIHRFDGLDRAWAQFPAGNEARAYFRWIGLEQLLGRVRGQYRLDVLIGEAARTLKLVDSSSLLAVAIHGLRGDILARQGRYRLALESWGEARRFAPDKRTVKHLERRRLLAHIRLDETASVGVVRNKVGLRGDESSMAEIVRDLIGLGDVLLSIMRFNPQTTRGRGWRQWFDGQWWFNEDTLITEIAAALECGDWVQGIHLDMILQEENRPTSEHVFRAELLRAWMRASLGDLDSAHTSFENLLARAVADEERLAQAFAHRGLAAVAYLREQTEPAITSLAAALSIERELDLTDANLLELELTGWRVLAGELTIADYNTKLAESEGVASPSYEFARLDSYLRFVASSNAVIQAAELGDFIAAPFIGTLEKCVSLREHSPWIRPACRVAAELAGRLADAGMPDEATQIRDAVRQLAANDPDLLALIGE
jgi:tetratricopeptide (TPR) repeat protein